MSDSSQLYFLDRTERPRRTELEEIDSPYLLADLHLPIGWLAMLHEQVKVPCNDFFTEDSKWVL